MVGTAFIHTIVKTGPGERFTAYGVDDGVPFTKVGVGWRAKDVLLSKLCDFAEGVRPGSIPQLIDRSELYLPLTDLELEEREAFEQQESLFVDFGEPQQRRPLGMTSEELRRVESQGNW